MEPQSQKGLQKYKTIAKIGQKKNQNDGKGKLAFFRAVYLVPVEARDSWAFPSFFFPFFVFVITKQFAGFVVQPFLP